MIRWILVMVLLLSSGPSPAVALVLRDGTVLDYGRMEFADHPGGDRHTRQYVPKDPIIRRITLPADAQGIHEVIVDTPAGRVYVVPLLPVGQHGVLVLEQKTLQSVGFLPGILSVTVPRHPKAAFVFLHRVAFEGSEASKRHLADSAEQPIEAMQRLPKQVERIRRKHPERLSRLQIVNRGGTLLACERVRGRGYPGHTRVDDVTLSLESKRRWNIGDALEARNEESAERGNAVDCWSDGTLLRMPADPYVPQKCMAERPDRTMGAWSALFRGEGRCELIAELPGVVRIGGSLVDLVKDTRTVVSPVGHAAYFPSGASATAYFGTRYEVFDDSKSDEPWAINALTRVGPPIRTVTGMDQSLSASAFPLGPAIDRVVALRAIDERILDALKCDEAGRPIVGQKRRDRPGALQPPECIDVPRKLRSEFTPADEVFSQRLPAIDIVGVVGDP